MKHQTVNVDYWAMFKAMMTYGALTVVGWLMIRLFALAFTLPRKLANQDNHIQRCLKELQRRFPDLNFTEDDLIHADKELDAIMQEAEEERRREELEAVEGAKANEEAQAQPPVVPVEEKKTQ